MYFSMTGDLSLPLHVLQNDNNLSSNRYLSPSSPSWCAGPPECRWIIPEILTAQAELVLDSIPPYVHPTN